VRARIVQLLPPLPTVEVTGKMRVLQVFDVKSKNASKVSATVCAIWSSLIWFQVYGVRILEGSLKVSDTVRVSRDGEVLGEAKLTSLKHFKEQVCQRNHFIASCSTRIDRRFTAHIITIPAGERSR
jgi:translation initiation factor IF-2